MKSVITLLFFLSFVNAQSFQSIIERLEKSPLEQRQTLIERYLNAKGISPIIEQDSLLHFVLYGDADTVQVIGNLQNWMEPALMTKIPCGPYSFFYRSFTVPPDSRLDYQLIIDGKYKTDPQNPNITPSGYGPHSEVRMPKFVSSPFLAFKPDVPRGLIDSLAPSMKIPPPLSFYRSAQRSIKVYRPAGYDTLDRLPSMYFHDGFETLEFTRAAVILDNLIAEKRIPPIVAVFIPPVDRSGEYIGSKKKQFLDYLCGTIVPMIDHLYRTDPSPKKRGMAGVSAGGTIALTSVLERSDIFLNAASQSGTILPEIRELTIARCSPNGAPEGMKIYLDCGRYDIVYEEGIFLEINREYSSLLSSLRVPHYYKEVNDGHEWASWRERLPDMLIYFFGGVQ